MYKSLLAASLIVLAAAPASFADPKFEYGKVDEVKDIKAPVWTATAEGGVVFTAGSSETTTATGGFKASRKAGDNKLSIEGSAAYARSSVRVLADANGNGLIDNSSEITSQESVTAETFAGKLRYDRFLTTSNSLFIAALASRDVPAGRESVFGGQIGYSRQLYKSAKSEAVGEAGYDFSREDPVTGEAIAIHSARVFVGFKSKMAEGVDFDSSLEFLTNLNSEKLTITDDAGNVESGKAFDDTRVVGHVAISAKIGKNLAFQTALDVKFDNRPSPLAIKNLADGYVPAAASVDTIMKASLIYTFF